MKDRYPFRLLIGILAVACGLACTGCWPAHPHSTYLKIHEYAINGDAAGVSSELVAHPDEINTPEDKGQTALHLAAENCHTNVVILLLDNGAKINVRAEDGATPLHLAAQEGCTDTVMVLINRKAKVNIRDSQGRTPLLRAKQWGQDGIVQMLKQHGGTE